MKIAIIVAMESELSLLLPLLDSEHTVEYKGFKFHCGHMGRHDIVVSKCGIGKVNAAVGAVTLIDRFEPDMVINSGVAGGTGASTHPLDIIVATGIAYHDVWCGPGTVEGAVQGLPAILPVDPEVLTLDCLAPGHGLHHGLIASGDRFISTAGEVEKINRVVKGAVACDMESGAIAQTCLLHEVPFACIRVISDTPGQADNIAQYENFWSDAPRRTFGVLKQVIAAMP